MRVQRKATMSSTTQILFNSPALHSLKRDQLLKLCKIHSLKATGKNVDLIEKLKQHALTLPRDSPLSIAARSEDASLPPHTSELLFSERPRPSEQWEVVMDSIDEADEMAVSQGTLTSQRTISQDKAAGEFGTGGSKSSVGSSLMALATSLGLKRPGTTSSRATSSVTSHSHTADIVSGVEETDELTRFATPYSHLPPAACVPQSDLFFSKVAEDGFAADVDMEEPVPGGALRPGVPAPDNARLSMGLGLTAPQTPSKPAQPTTTIRLVQNSENMSPSTPQLAPFKTTFDLIMSPPMSAGVGFGTFSSATTWSSSIYPSLPTDINEPAIHESPPVSMTTNVASAVAGSDGDITMPGAFSSPSSSTENAKMGPISGNNALGPPNEPFIFGSPLPKHRVSDAQFREAAASVLDEMNKRLQAEGVGGVDMDIIKRLHSSSHAEGIQTLAASGINKCQTGEIKEMFDKKHQAEFEKMEGIDALVKRKAAKLHGQSKQGSDDKVVAGKKRKSSVLIDESRRMPSQVVGRASGTRVISNGRRSKMIPGAFDVDDYDREADANDERGMKRVKVENGAVEVHNAESQAQKEKEREAIRRKLELSKARRRSSRQSGSRVQQKQKPSRFGFLAQAKSLVQSVFGRSKVAASTVTAPTTSSKAKAGRQDPEPSTKKLPMASSSKNPVDNSRPTDSITNTSSVTSLGSRASTTLDKERRSFSSARSRSPIPPYTGPSTSTARLAPVKRPSASVALTHSRSNSSSSDISSTGNKLRPKIPSTSTFKSAANVSAAAGSFGVKKASDRGHSSLSRLHAPTASSLAKMGGRTSVSATSSLRESKQNVGTSMIKKETALSSIINNVAHEEIAAQGPMSPPVSGQIFSKPLTPYAVGSAGTVDGECHNSNVASASTSKHPLQRQRTLSGRKPRISRSKVISRLASQRASATKSNDPAIRRSSATGKPLSTPRTRSSLSAKVKKPVGRSSHTGVGLTNASDLLMSARMRARQSEYQARRQSRMETAAIKQSLA
ncbi:hypothetical protein M378DRAFT_99834 [Amanita muscaria Koide BX008]|uniref:SAP domain-containing protein n=1 Tax=Amanita muscaria (strain Koide BX008) TaxID=946122 RepID=A0A0C2XG16_AMAMK|nr:hypothetical protein M378DRAFT_99834 [Amanita muscaria Koide BX008]